MSSDDSPGLSAARVCSLAGVRPQTRDSWAARGLVRDRSSYGLLDVREVAVVRELLDRLPKGQVITAWSQVREQLRSFHADRPVSLVWDPQLRTAELVTADDRLVELVRVGRPVYVVALEGALKQVSDAYRVEVAATRGRRIPGAPGGRKALRHGG